MFPVYAFFNTIRTGILSSIHYTHYSRIMRFKWQNNMIDVFLAFPNLRKKKPIPIHKITIKFAILFLNGVRIFFYLCRNQCYWIYINAIECRNIGKFSCWKWFHMRAYRIVIFMIFSYENHSKSPKVHTVFFDFGIPRISGAESMNKFVQSIHFPISSFQI